MFRKTCSKFQCIAKLTITVIILATGFISTKAQTSVCFSIESESEQFVNSGQYDSGSSDLELGYENGNPQIVGLRFTGINIPANATVSNATLQFAADETSSGSSDLNIMGELTGNAAPFNETTLFNISNRATTNNSVNWLPFQWIAGSQTNRQKTPDLSPIINEIIGSNSFVSGNAIAFIIDGTGKRTATNTPIELCLTYSICGAQNQPCDDGNLCTLNDVWDNNCNCIGTPDVDSDNDGVCNNIDPCPNSATDDSDNDGVCDDTDICLPGNDNIDNDNDGTPDDCDNCVDVNQNNICDDVDPQLAGDIIINEVNYRSVELQSDIDFIEIYNADATTINLTGWAITDAINYNFPAGTTISPGQYIVVAANPAKCQAELNFSGALGPYTGKLSSNKDNIVLRNENFFIVDKVDYKSWDEWPAVRYSDYSVNQPIPYNTAYTDDVKIKVAKSIQKINPNLNGKHGGSWLAGNPTPKARNTTYSSNYSNIPVIKKVSKKPNNPVSGIGVVIKASFDDFQNYANILSVNLEYQSVSAGSYIAKSDGAYQSNWGSIAMQDNSLGADSLANDGIYTATIPSSVQVHRNLVRYRIKVTTSNGYSKTYPDQNHTESNYAYYVYNGDASFNGYSFSNLNPLQSFTVITKSSIAEQYIGNGTDNATQYTGYDYLGEGTIVYNGQVYDHIRFRPRGKTRSIRVKPGIKFELNDEHKIEIIDDCGDAYDIKRDKLVLSGTWVNDASSHGLVESLVYKILKFTKGIFKYCDYTTLRIVDRSQETGNSGDFWGIYLIQEEYDGELLEEHNLPDGNIWTTYDPVGQKRFMYVDSYGDYPGSKNQNEWFTPADVGFTTSQLTPSTSTLDKWTFYGDMAANEIWANGEFNYVGKHSYREYYNPETNLWIGWCKDYDGAFGSGNNVEAVSTTNDVNYNFDVTHPMVIPSSLQIEYEGYLRSAYDLLLNSQQSNFLVDQETKMIYSPTNSYDWTTLDHSRWNNYQAYGEGNVDNQFQWYKNWFPNRANYLINNGTKGILDNDIPNKPTINLTGSHQLDNLTFFNSNFSDPNFFDAFSALEWRVGEWSDPSNTFYTTECEARYEIEDYWVSGEINSFSNSFTMPAEAKLRAGRTYKVRVRYKDNSGRWSHWSDPYTFKAQPAINQNSLDVIINEINYNPTDECGTEFVEIYNKENSTVNLDNYIFSEGIDYEFPPGSSISANDYLVIARDSIEFTQKYGFAPFGDYSNSLSNGGEQIILEGPYGRFTNNITYSDDPPWNNLPDGNGATLSLGSSTLDNSLASSWTASKSACGTPGSKNDICADLKISATVFDVSCNGNNDGFINVSVNGGEPQFTYDWGNGINNSLISNLAPGNYSVTVTDKFLCTSTGNFTVAEPSVIQPNLSKTDETLYQANDGTASLSVTGGVGQYSYDWSNGAANSASVSGLAPGSYSVTITDSEGCFVIEQFTINAITCNPLMVDVSIVDDSCTGNGMLEVDSTLGGTLPYSYEWSDGTIGAVANNLVGGDYDLTVTDAKGCSFEDTYTVNTVSNINETLSITPASSSTSTDGSIDVSVSGGTAPYTFSWSNGSTNEDRNNVQAGTYSVVITDANGCTKIITNIVVNVDNCTSQITQNNQPMLTNGLYRVSNYIESNAMISSSGNISFKAGSYIELVNDFEVKQGAEFEAIIDSCQ